MWDEESSWGGEFLKYLCFVFLFTIPWFYGILIFFENHITIIIK